MTNIKIDFKKTTGKIKPINAVNNGPKVPLNPNVGQNTGNFQLYADLCIPFARNHDAALCSNYGGEHTVDITAIFPDFDADVNSPDSYDFTLSDDYHRTIEKAGTKVFYRLGESIEFRKKKYKICVPPDFQKWAEICEHIIRHYTEGWANGFHMDIEYWEIWNEADGDAKDEGECKRTWGGTELQFYELYTVTAKHLKKCFPHLKIGGPAVSTLNYEDWVEDFFKYISEHNAPMDFFSWHCYCSTPETMIEHAEKAKKYMEKYGYGNAESILNEWNYVTSFSGDEWVYSLKTENNIKGAVFCLSSICASQNTSIDMLMYYDARIGTVMNGLFDVVSLSPQKLYHGFKMLAEIRRLENQLEMDIAGENIYGLASKKDDEFACMICHYSDEREKEIPNKTIALEIDNAEGKEYEFYLLNEEFDGKLVKREFSSTGKTILYFDMEPQSVLFIKSV